MPLASQEVVQVGGHVQLLLGVYVHVNVVGLVASHLSSVQGLASSQGLSDETHTPFAQTSTSVQGSPSSQGSVFGLNEHCPALHVSVVHGFPSLHCASAVHPGVPPKALLGFDDTRNSITRATVETDHRPNETTRLVPVADRVTSRRRPGGIALAPNVDMVASVPAAVGCFASAIRMSACRPSSVFFTRLAMRDDLLVTR
jgi:hypothetical protein